MSTIGERIKYSIDHIGKGEIHAALEHACNAVDVTSQRHFSKTHSSRKTFKKFIGEYYWLIEFISDVGINLDETMFKNYPIEVGRKQILEPTFSDLMYHVVRCGLVHSDSLQKGFAFHNLDKVILGDKKITFPTKVVWGMLATVIFCPKNKEEETAPNYWIAFRENKLVINDFFGNEEVARHLVKVRYPMPRVTIIPRSDGNQGDIEIMVQKGS